MSYMRYYKLHSCIICGESMIYNQYRKNRLFSRIAHIDCVKGGNHGRMNDRVMIKTIMVNKIQGWKKVWLIEQKTIEIEK